MDWPEWWHWEIEITPHCVKRMSERRFGEVDLRTMLEDATGMSEQARGTFVVETTHDGAAWEVIVTPDAERQRIVVITAYALS